jgi:transposase-like protein
MKNKNTNKNPSDSENRKSKPKCIYCNSNKTKKRGFRKTENRGKIQRYFCNECKKAFVIDDGFFRMRNNPQKITCALDLFYRGVSTRKVQEHFKAFLPHNSSNVSIYNWVVKYSKKISNFTDNLKINGGSEVQLDEMEYHRRISHKKIGVSKDWFIDSVDVKTRYMVSSKYFNSRGQNELREVMKKVKYKRKVTSQLSLQTAGRLMRR